MATWIQASGTNTGTTNSSATWTTDASSNTSHKWVRRLPAMVAKPEPIKRDPFMKKDFWDGVEWKEYTSYIPRKSITGKWIIGPMHKRWRTPPIEHRGPNGIGTFHQYAGKKELFGEKLRGNA